MRIANEDWRTIWIERAADGRPRTVGIIDQTRLPHELRTTQLASLEDAAHAIRAMLVRGAPLIGATAAFGVALAMEQDASDPALTHARDTLLSTRPTAVNLRWALDAMMRRLAPLAIGERPAAAWARAEAIADEDVAINAAIGDHGLAVLRDLASAKGSGPLNILTHCNAGWLATVDWGTATAPIYKAHDAGLPVHVYVDETRPRLQGAALTAWELDNHGVPHHVIVDNAGGHMMQRGLIDAVIVGTDRTSANGDVCNKIGTYLKALAAHDNGVPFYVTLPTPTIDRSLDRGNDIPIEERDPVEVTHILGRAADGKVLPVRITPEASPALNYGFDVTPARLISALITERGVVAASATGIASLFAHAVEDAA